MSGNLRLSVGRNKVLGLLVALLTAAVYLALPERVYFFDGVSFAGGIEYALENPGHPDVLYRFPKHYLYIPTVYGLARGISWVMPATPIDAYRIMQILAGTLAGLLNGILFLFLKRRIASTAASLGLVALWAFSNIHWERALEGQTYFAGQFWAILALVIFAWRDEPPSRPAIVVMAACTALGGLFHVSNVIVVAPIAMAWLWRDGPRAVRSLAAYITAATVLTALPPLIHYRFWDPVEVRRWFLASVNDTEFYSSGFFMVPTLQSLWRRSILLFSEFLVPLRGGWLPRMAGLLLTALFLALLGAGLWHERGGDPEKRRSGPGSPLVALGVATFATWAIFFSVATPGYLFHWEVAFFGLWLLLVAGFARDRTPASGLPLPGPARVDPHAEGRHLPGRRSPARSMAVGLGILAIAVPSFNLARKYWPISRPGFNRDARAAARLGPMIPPSEPLLLLGAGTGDNNLKAYMIHFGQRGWLAADIIMKDAPPQDRCQAFAAEVRARLRQRGVVFLSTTLLDPSSRARVSGHHGCPDHEALLPIQAMRCLVLDPTQEVGLVLGWSGHEAALASLQGYYRSVGQAALAQRLAVPEAFATCHDLPAARVTRLPALSQSASVMLLAWEKSSR